MKMSHIVYDRMGRGRPLVLLHGLGHRKEAWHPVLRTLAAEHDVIAPDLPGFGKSSAPGRAEPYDIRWLVDSVAQFCERAGVERPHLVGNSLGGAIALELGARGFAASVTAFSPIGFTTVREGLFNRILTLGMWGAARLPGQLLAAAAGTPPALAIARRVLRGEEAEPSGPGPRFDTTAIAVGSPFTRLAPEVATYSFGPKELSCPVTIAWGRQDRVLAPRAARRAVERIRYARLVTLLGCGHVPMLDRPDLVAGVILETTRAAVRERRHPLPPMAPLAVPATVGA
ncbi:alpha/beta fold hydrolase [Nocardiopsis ansamitocini]|nr:alpha/beta hydrolase [Nocardiopsis ansamitocini]